MDVRLWLFRALLSQPSFFLSSGHKMATALVERPLAALNDEGYLRITSPAVHTLLELLSECYP